ncbi:MAG TPA: uroporphyrinogen decarboxylase family protein [Bryobacteraceae bacterium]|nr:uroporphyrinogen decarboxylase family protein [Bryobacteraceae bacterium]
MESRERVLRAIHFGKPDRPPISHAILPSAQYHYGEALRAITDAVPEDFGWSCLPDLPAEKLPPLYKEGEHRDEFGTLWRVTQQGRCGIPIEYPIAADWSNYAQFRWPVFGAGVPKYRLYSGHMAGTDPSYYARGGWITFFEQMQQLHGFEATLVDLASGRREIYRLRDDLLEFNLDWLDRWLEHPYQGIHFADDWGSQTSLLISPAQWRAFFKPVYQAMFSKVKQAGMHVWYHSDGNITQILPDILELGVDVLNCQSSLIGTENLRPLVGKICFRTDIDRQHVLPFVSPGEVRRYIFELFETLGTPEGGIIACGEVIEDVPLANIEAMYQAFLEFRY